MENKAVLEKTLGIPFSDGNTVTVLKNGDEIFPAMLEAIDAATQNIDFLTYVYWRGDIAKRFAKALALKSEQGVKVQVLLDSFGARLIKKEILEIMWKSGVEIVWFRPLLRWKIWKTDNRTHRKILVCDGELAFTGGVGIAEEWEGDARSPSEWRETHFRISGPAVSAIKAAFLENWVEAKGKYDLDLIKADAGSAGGNVSIQILRSSASVRWSQLVILYQALIELAEKSILICTAYFNPNDILVDALIKKAGEGVGIKIMLPGKYADRRITKISAEDNFQLLLQAGVEIFYYEKTMLHTKIMLIDDALSCIGSANFNQRSMLKDDEISLVVLDENISKSLRSHFAEDINFCVRVSEKRWRRRGMLKRLRETLIKLVKQEL